MFSGCLQDFSRMFSGCFVGSCRPGGIWWSFQKKVWTLMIQRNSMIPNYSMIPAIWWSLAIWWSPALRWSPAIQWSIGSMDFDNWNVYSDTSITDGLVYIIFIIHTWPRYCCPMKKNGTKKVCNIWRWNVCMNCNVVVEWIKPPSSLISTSNSSAYKSFIESDKDTIGYEDRV